MWDQEEIRKLLLGCAFAVATYDPQGAQEDNFTYYADPTKIKTYLSCGLPVIMTNVPFNAGDLARRGCAVIVDYDEKSIAKVLIDVLTDKEKLETMRKSAIKTAGEFTWEEILRRLCPEKDAILLDFWKDRILPLLNEHIYLSLLSYVQKSLLKKGDRLSCRSCRIDYEIREGIPILVDLSKVPEHLHKQIRYFEHEDETRGDWVLEPWQARYVRKFLDTAKPKPRGLIVDNATGSGYMAIELAKRGVSCYSHRSYDA